MRTKDAILKGMRKCYCKLNNIVFLPEDYELDRQISNDWIYDLLVSDKPCMISRFGSGEINIVTNYLAVHSNAPFLLKCKNYITKQAGLPWWDELFLKSMRNNMGIFPESIEMLERFSERYLNDSVEIDLLGSMSHVEKYMPTPSNMKKVHIESLYPFFVEHPWTRALTGKKVLVIHPFVFSIQKQYKIKDKLFGNSEIWPDYDLITYRAIQSNAGAAVPYKDWFDALYKMENDIDRIDYDIAILGCGAYGLPLAAHIKRIGKKAIHIGGGSQLLFGIKGKRWESKYKYKYLPESYNTEYRSLFNEYWCRPSSEETPINANNVEGACYW